LGHYKRVFLFSFSFSTIGAIVDLNSDGLIHYSSEDCISGNTRMIMTFYLEEFEKSDVKTLVNEMGFDPNTLECIGNDTYKPCSEDETHYVNKISESLKERFNVDYF